MNTQNKRNRGNSRKVIVEETVIYDSVAECAAAESIDVHTLIDYLRGRKRAPFKVRYYDEWRWKDEEE